MSLWNSLRETLIATLRHRRLWLIQFFANLLLMLWVVGIVHMPDSYAWQVIASILMIALLVVMVAILQGGTLNYCLETDRNKASALQPPFWNALKHVVPVILLMVILYFLYDLIGRLDNYQYSFPRYLRSEFPAWLRRIVSEPAVRGLYSAFLTFLRCILLPGLFLPLALLCADRNFRGFFQLRIWLRMLLNLAWWIVVIVAWFLGIWCVAKLLHWTLDPKTASLHGEQIWLAFRLIVSCLLAIFSWLWVCTLLARARIKAEAAMEKSPAV
ncbi:MAG: hypothetical protein DMG65_05845 [Candidatus Angelobacter sp. Gp1-AA117]|nr:MAG: hypothetical protein DMG65_05845 [Candidatus Angelobacter sp. Gp1-AA117]